MCTKRLRKLLIASAVFVVVSPSSYTQAGIITTFAGRTWSFTGQDGPATEAPLGTFLGIAFDPRSGRTVIADPENRHLYELEASGTLRILAGTGAGGLSPDGTPARSATVRPGGGIVFDPNGRLLFGDNGLTLRALSGTSQTQSNSVSIDGTVVSPITVPPIVAQGGVLNAASFAPGEPLSPGAMASVFGSGLSRTVVPAPTIPLPTQLDQSSVSVSGTAAPLYVVTEGQANLQVPFEITADTEQWLVIRRGNALSVPEPFPVSSASPALFTVDGTGTGQAHVYGFSSGAAALATGGAGAKAGEVLLVYASGMGPVSGNLISGSASPVPAATVRGAVKLSVGGRPVEVLFAGLAPGFVGLYQINFRMPQGLPPGINVPIELDVNGTRSRIAFLGTMPTRPAHENGAFGIE
jgi:uncharacterized protein (TIGR03437 family)